MKALATLTVLILAAAFPVSLGACSMAGCLGNGIELRTNFVIKITHDDRPLSGVSVQITNNSESSVNKSFSAKTRTDGTVRVSKLPPGDYWLNAELLGVVAGIECFHINPKTSRKAKKIVNFEWGEFAPEARRAVGRLIDSQPGNSRDPLWNLTHRVEAPVTNAKLTLRSPFSDTVYTTLSDELGQFAFREIPNGLYVLHLEGGTTTGIPTSYSADLIFRLSDSAKQKTLVLTERDAGGGSCGGWSIEPDYATGLERALRGAPLAQNTDHEYPRLRTTQLLTSHPAQKRLI